MNNIRYYMHDLSYQFASISCWIMQNFRRLIVEYIFQCINRVPRSFLFHLYLIEFCSREAYVCIYIHTRIYIQIKRRTCVSASIYKSNSAIYSINYGAKSIADWHTRQKRNVPCRNIFKLLTTSISHLISASLLEGCWIYFTYSSAAKFFLQP